MLYGGYHESGEPSRDQLRGWSRRRLLGLAGLGVIAAGTAGLALTLQSQEDEKMLTVYTFGDSILDCGHYNQYGVHPGQLIVRNNDKLFPDFKGNDFSSKGPARLEHRAQDGATVHSMERQAQGIKESGRGIALVTVGGNDLLQGLVMDEGPGITAFHQALDSFLKQLPVRPLLLGNVYDPSFGDDSRNFLGVDPVLARANHERINIVIAELASRYGVLVDLHSHFLKGDPSWYTQTIEPSLTGASEVRRAFLQRIST